MNEVRHTPGPWQVRHDHGATTKTFGGPHVQAGKRVIAWPEFPSVDENDTSEANARLIAAAPDLLDALTDLVGGCGKEGDLYSSTAIGKARAAIEKATLAREG